MRLRERRLYVILVAVEGLSVTVTVTVIIGPESRALHPCSSLFFDDNLLLLPEPHPTPPNICYRDLKLRDSVSRRPF